MSKDLLFDRFYAVKHTRIVLRPTHMLETFDNTLVNYHLVSELEDVPGKIRVREGRIEAHRPLVLTPSKYAEVTMEGFGEKAREYVEFLRQHEDDMRILQYGYRLKRDNFSETVVTDTLDAVVERVKREVVDSNDRFAAVLTGVDEPWDVALIELWRSEVNRSAEKNLNELNAKGALWNG